MNISNSTFSGPIFVVGLPRSGTKLLRDLLNQHPDIGMPNVESQFLPYWSKNWASFSDLSIRVNFNLFYGKVIQLPYFVSSNKEHDIISADEWFGKCNSYDIAGVFEALIRHDVDASRNSNKIWGDKTPSYIIHIPFLKSIFPNAKFIHIVRDVRDYSLSSKKTWGKNMVRATVRWHDRLATFQKYLSLYPNDILELKYENLIDDHEKELRQVCKFLSLSFDYAMLKLSRPSEQIGDAKGQNRVVTGNKNKYLTEVSPKLISRLERIAKPYLEVYGYPVNYKGEPEHVSRIQLWVYQLMDGFNLVRFETKEQGLLKALNFRWTLFKTSGNRLLEKF